MQCNFYSNLFNTQLYSNLFNTILYSNLFIQNLPMVPLVHAKKKKKLPTILAWVTHTRLASVQNSRTRFLDFGQLFNLDFIDFFTTFFFLPVFWLHLVHIKPMQLFPPINTLLNLHHFLTLSPSSSHYFTFIVFVFL